ncbi:universal stress protein [Dactylosporangium sp. NPDC000521]|uniref:universal stress protein n=1 Tax=Dactylosporangium sp. NPDC000521 TaxID=3363975 RepID=UPI0036A390AC
MTFQARPVLAGLDDADDELVAVRAGAVEARLRDQPLHLFSAFAPPPPDALPEAPWPPRDAALARMMRAVAAAGRSIDVDARMVCGDLAAALVAQAPQASLVVLAAAAAARPDGGSGACPVACRSAVPVLVVPARPATQGAPVMAGLASGAASDAILEFAFDEAARRGVPLRVVHLSDAATAGHWHRSELLAGLSVPAPPTVGSTPADLAERLLAESLAGWPARYPDVRIERCVVHGPDVEHGIATLTRDACMIVVAARSRLETGARILGPVTGGLLRDAGCPVAVVAAADRVLSAPNGDICR